MAVQFDITGDNSGFLGALQASVNAAKKAGEDVSSAFSKVSDVFEGITKAVGVFAAAVAGGEAFSKAIDATKQLTENSINLGKAMGISASEASGMMDAIQRVGGTTDDLAGATRGLTRELRTHEEALNSIGITTRDSAGNLRNMNDIMLDAVAVVNSYAEGTDRNLAAQIAFGRGMSGMSPVLRLTKEDMAAAKKNAEELGLVVGKQNVADFEANRRATSDAHDVMTGLKKAIGDELLPVLTQFGEWFREIGPDAILVLRTAMADLVTVFWTLYAAVNAVWEIIKAMVISVIGPLSALGEAIYLAATGHWDQAKQVLAEIGPTLKATWSASFDSIVADAQKAAAKIKQAFTDPTGDAVGSPKNDKHIELPGSSPKGVEKSHEYAKMLIDQANEILDTMKKVDEEEFDSFRQTQLGEIAAKEEALGEQLKLGQISSAEFMKQETDLIDFRLKVQKEYYAKKLEIEHTDEVASAKIQTEITKAEADAQKERQKALNTANNAQVAQWRRLGQSIESSLTSSLAGLINGTKSFTDVIRSLFDSLIQGIIGIFVKMAVQWAENMILQKILGKQTAASQISANAGIAATAAMASIAAIPFYGWAAAPAVGAATFGEAMGYEAALSAAGGYDVPSGINPVTQLHSKEMVLPAQYADVIRGLSGGDKASPTTNVHIHAWDGASVQSWLHGGGAEQIGKAIKRAHGRGDVR